MATDWLKTLRTEKFPSQAALALAAGIKPARYSRIEKGYCDMREEEIDGLAKALKLTADEVRNVPTDPAKVKPAEVKVAVAVGVGAARVAAAAQPSEPVLPPSVPATPKPVVVEATPGDSLDDPKSFSLMPPVELLSDKEPESAAVRAQLQKATTFAEKVLHTSKVRPAVWVAWRDFSRDAQKVLRGSSPAAAAPAVPKPIARPQIPIPMPKPQPARPAVAKDPSKHSASRVHGNKNIFGHFADVAKEWLPEATRAALSEKALAAKTSNPEMGFMKHFKRIAEIDLPPAEYERINNEASRRDGSGA